MTTRIHLGFHFYGAGNIGDEVMVQGFLQELKRRHVTLPLTCCTPFDIESQRLRFPEIRWLAYDTETRRRAVEDCDIWLGLGDTPFQSDCGGWFFEHLRFELELIREFRRPAYMLGVGINNHEAVANRETEILLHDMRMVWTRDAASATALAQVAGWTRIHPAADLAHLNFETRRAPIPHPPDQEPLILVIHSENPDHITPEVLDEVITGHAGPVYWYCQEVREFGCTELATYRRLSAAARAKAILVHPDYHTESILNLISVFDHGGVCLTSRYHSAVLAAWMGLRVGVFARNAKLDGIIEQLNLTRIQSLSVKTDITDAIHAAKTVDAELLRGLRHAASDSCLALLRMTSS